VKAAIAQANTAAYSSSDTPAEGSLASDEALQALREKLTGGAS
jgi:small subunit ribosomal protein S1